jgi:hypothetical protein
MISVPDDLPDDPAALKQLLAQLLAERTVDKGQIVDLKEQVKLLRDRLFNRKSSKPSSPTHPNWRCLTNLKASGYLPLMMLTKTLLPRPSRVANANPCRLTYHVLKSFMTCPITN